MTKTFMYYRNLGISLFIIGLHIVQTQAAEFEISFTASGAATTLDRVVAQNLTQAKETTVEAGSLLTLTDATALEIVREEQKLQILTNRATGEMYLSYFTESRGYTMVKVYSVDVKNVLTYGNTFDAGINTFSINLPQGVFIVEINEGGTKQATRVVSTANLKPSINFTGNSSMDKSAKAKSSTPPLQYNTGDRMLFKAYSGDYVCIVTAVINESKTVDFNFVECKDADGNYYSTVKIDSQVWMAENLKTKKYRNGEQIGTTTPANKHIGLESNPKYQWAYNADENMANKFGRLYTWHAVTDSRNIAPQGWHVSTDTEWTILQNYLITNGYNYDGTTTGNKIAKALAANTDWLTANIIGAIGNDLTKNNSSGFSALPAGYRDFDGSTGGIPQLLRWWISYSYPLARFMSFGSSYLEVGDTHGSSGFSVRCVKD